MTVRSVIIYVFQDVGVVKQNKQMDSAVKNQIKRLIDNGVVGTKAMQKELKIFVKKEIEDTSKLSDPSFNPPSSTIQSFKKRLQRKKYDSFVGKEVTMVRYLKY